jgi:hypothetical protein
MLAEEESCKRKWKMATKWQARVPRGKRQLYRPRCGLQLQYIVLPLWLSRDSSSRCHWIYRRMDAFYAINPLRSPIPETARSVCGRSLAGITNPHGQGMDLCLLWVLCDSDWLITRAEESYRVCCVWTRSWSLDPPGTVQPWEKKLLLSSGTRCRKHLAP